MALCSNCGSQLPEGAATCPTCGQPQAVPRSAGVGVARRTDQKALASLILGIVGLFACPLIAGILAVVIGNQAKANIAADPTLEGEGMAKAGVILGWVGIALTAFWLLLMIATPFGMGMFG